MSITLEEINKVGIMPLDLSEATLEDISVLYEYYSKVLEDSKKEVEQLRAEVKASWSEIDVAKVEEKKCAVAGNEKAYMKARYRRDMHEERIAAHESRLVDLVEGHLIDEKEYQKILGIMRHLGRKIANESAAKFMEHVRALENVCAEYDTRMKPVHALGKLLQEEVYRKREQFDTKKIEYYSSSDHSHTFWSVLKVICENNKPHSISYGQIKNMASNALKAEIAAGDPGLEDVARRYAAGDADGKPWPRGEQEKAKEALKVTE